MRGFIDIISGKSSIPGGLALFILACAACVSYCVQAAGPEQSAGTPEVKTAEIVVDGSSVTGPVNRRILGQNILAYQQKKFYSMQGGGLWDPVKAAPLPEMITLLKESGAKTLRWPGGCTAHDYNWKLTVGPLSQRPNLVFGLPEFLKCCEAAGADPVLTLGDYWGKPDDFADLVEYLNSPVGKNPNGGKDWAEVRAEDGHPEPYNVVWFEYGNESSHGSHNQSRDVWLECCSKSKPDHKTGTRSAWYAYTPAQYSELYLLVQKAMKAVDPKIKLGAILDNEYQPGSWHDWTFEVVKKTGAHADFYINHIYMASYDSNCRLPAAELFRLGFSGASQTELLLENISRYIRKTTGRNLPLAITEFNCGIDQELPAPYRFSQGAAVMVAEMVLTMMTHSEFNINNAQYWQFCNEHWGMISNFDNLPVPQKRSAPIKRPVFLAYALCNKYLGDSFVESRVDCDTYETRGGFGMQPATGHPIAAGSPPGTRRAVKPDWEITPDKEYQTQVNPDGSLSVKILGKLGEYCHAQVHIPTEPTATYEISAEVKTDGNPDIAATFEISDGRAWNTYTRDITAKGSKSDKWVKISRRYESLLDSGTLAVRMKCICKNPKDAQAFSFSVRNFAIKKIGVGQDLGRIPYIQVYASKNRDGGFGLILVNRNILSPAKVRIKGLKGTVTSAEVLAAPSVDSTNEEKPTCKISALNYAVMPDGTLELTLPPHSLSGVATR